MVALKLAAMILVAGVAVVALVAKAWPLVSVCVALNTALWLLHGNETEE
jgi:hypothetical protein